MDYREFITKNKSDFVKEALFDELEKADIIHESERASLSEGDKYSKSSRLWDKIKQKDVAPETLSKIFEDVNQNGVVTLLKSALPDNQYQNGTTQTPDTAIAVTSDIPHQETQFVQNGEPVKAKQTSSTLHTEDYQKWFRSLKKLF